MKSKEAILVARHAFLLVLAVSRFLHWIVLREW